MNGFEEFRDWAHDKVYSEEETEELLKELKTWGKEIWKIVSKESKAIGTRHTERGNKRECNRSRVKNFKVGDLVLKKIINQRNKMGKCWEGPFEILAFDKKHKGYHVREMEGKYLNDLIPVDQLCQVAELADDKSVSWEVASTSFTFVVSLNKQQIVDCDRANNYGRPELFVSDFSARAARFGRRRRRESFVC